MPRDLPSRWFVDETSLGLGRALATVRGDVLYPGHRRLLEVPESTPDLEWMPVIAELRLVVISRDRHIKSKQAELQAYIDYRIRAFWIAGDRDMGNWDNLNRIVRWWDKLERIVAGRPDGPWFYEVHQTRVSEVRVQPRIKPPRPLSSPPPKPRRRDDQLDLGM